MNLRDWPWETPPDCERLLKALQRSGDPSHVPFLELFADREIIAAVLDEPAIPREAERSDRETLETVLDRKIRFWHRLGYDAFWQGAGLDLPDMLRLEASDTACLPREKREWVDEKAGVITDWADFERYPWPRAEDADLHPLEYVSRHLPEGMGIIGAISGVLEPVMWLMGYETFALAIYDQPDLIEAMFARIAEIIVPLARTVVQMDRVIALWMGDDMGFKTGTMIAPDELRRLVFPIQKQVADVAHEQGMPFLLHSCGNLEAVMEDLVDYVGIDGKHSFEDVIEPVESFTERYGDRVSVIGGVDVNLLARGTEEQVRARTREVLKACAPSRAYVLGSGNSIANYIPIGNFLAMIDEGHHYNSGYLD
jgi:uroporphyrinogen decarboxylase